MTGLWEFSYFALWVLAVIIFGLQITTLHRLGEAHAASSAHASSATAKSERDVQPLERDGPTIGSRLPTITGASVSNFDASVTESDFETAMSTLLVFMSPTCATCQDIVEPINALIRKSASTLRVLGVMRGDTVSCAAFNRVFPLDAPLVADPDSDITRGLDIHSLPLGLFYDFGERLVRKGTITCADDLRAIMGDTSAPKMSRAQVYPTLLESETSDSSTPRAV